MLSIINDLQKDLIREKVFTAILFQEVIVGASIENGIQLQTVNVSGQLLLRRFSPAPLTPNTCACSVAADCPDPSWFMGNFVCQYGRNCTAGTVVWRFPGYLGACNTAEAFFKSSLECLFNQTCIDIILSMFNVDIPDRLPLSADTLTIKALNASQLSSFKSNDTLDTISRKLMIDEWIIEPSYEAYYNECAPVACTYVLNRRMDLVYVATSMIGLIGGLSVSLSLLIPVVLYYFNWLWLRWCQCRTNNQHEAIVVRSKLNGCFVS